MTDPTPQTERSLVLVKPDGYRRGLTGEVLRRIEAKGYRLVQVQLRSADRDLLAQHYAEHEGKPFFDGLVSFLTRSPLLAMVVEGPEDTWKVVRTLMGVTNPRDAAPGTIRGDLATLLGENLVHGSDGPDAAAREIALFFPHL